jgi:hypothetical protein
MLPEFIIRKSLESLEKQVTDPAIQHTHKIPYIRGQIDLLKFILEEGSR